MCRYILFSLDHSWVICIRHIFRVFCTDSGCSMWTMVFWVGETLLHWVWRGNQEVNISHRPSHVADACGSSVELFSHGHTRTTGCSGPKLHCADVDKQGCPPGLPRAWCGHFRFLLAKSELKTGVAAQLVKCFALQVWRAKLPWPWTLVKDQEWWCTLENPALGRSKQEDPQGQTA